MAETASRTALTASCMHCRTPIQAIPGKFYCSDKCRLLEWAKRQESRRVEVLPSQNETTRKRESRGRKVMDLLVRGPVRTFDLMRAGGSGFSSRLAELREDLIRFGWGIRCETDDDGATYQLEAL